MKNSRVTLSECSICRRLSSHNYADLRDSQLIPEHLQPLVGASPDDLPAEEIIRCPVCGTSYLYLYNCGFGENDIELRRITPTHAGRDPDLASLASDLHSPDEETRAHASRSLVEYYLWKDMPEEAEALTGHEDEIIRSSAEAARKYYLQRKQLES
ncbi:MAG TPA: hypothetical protein VGB73_16360 [Pyrinomonadaceae bacterium]|jgi:hypothetical protein